jgi:hypothetical protein
MLYPFVVTELASQPLQHWKYGNKTSVCEINKFKKVK